MPHILKHIDWNIRTSLRGLLRRRALLGPSIFVLALGAAASGMASDTPGPDIAATAGYPATAPLRPDNFEAFRAFDPVGHARHGDEVQAEGRPLDAWAEYLVAATQGDPYGEVQFARLLLTGLPWQDQRHPDQPPPHQIDQAIVWLTKARARGVPVVDFYLAMAADPAASQLRGPHGVTETEISETPYPWPPTRMTRQRVHPESWGLESAALAAFYADRDARYQAAPHTGDALTPRQMADFGRALWAGDGVDRNTEKGLWVIAQAARAGDADAIASLGDIALQMGALTAARGWYAKASAAGDAYAATRLGLMQRDGVGGPRDLSTAITSLRQAVEKGDPDGQFALAAAFERGDGLPKDVEAAEALYRRAADGGSAEALARRADALAAAGHVADAMTVWAVAADHGSPVAATRLAGALMASPDADAASLRAFAALRMAEKLNYTPAFEMLSSNNRFAAPYSTSEADLIAAGHESRCSISQSKGNIERAVAGSVLLMRAASQTRLTCDYTQDHPTVEPMNLSAGSVLYVAYPPILTYSKNIVIWVRRLDIAGKNYSNAQCLYVTAGGGSVAIAANSFDVNSDNHTDLSTSMPAVGGLTMTAAPGGNGFTMKARAADILSYRDCAMAESGRE